ncbi:pyruvate formate lyase-activating protein [Candidatus Bathyarchaeota archaeon]|nr:pyruvate formate lyase-activating protein [Candidatus Bathyarchaeota archaeon]
MKAALFDIGAGTLDFLLYESNKNIENCVKMVLPSPQGTHVSKLEEITNENKDLYIDGYTVGGGGLGNAVKQHISKGLQVNMTPSAAYSIRNNLSEVEKLRVNIVDQKPENCKQLSLDELRLPSIEKVLNSFNESLMDVDVCGVSVKDHGAAPAGISNRVFRMENYRKTLKKDNRLSGFLYKAPKVQEYYLRMNAIVDAVRDTMGPVPVYLLDTSISALAGCLMDTRIINKDPVLVVNIGNGHTVAAVVSEDRIYAFFEHHTSMLDQEKLEYYLKKLSEGSLERVEVFEDGGHGSVTIMDPPGFSGIERIAVTGPKRRLLEGSELDYIEASPGGDVMMTGTLGLLKVIQDK